MEKLKVEEFLKKRYGAYEVDIMTVKNEKTYGFIIENVKSFTEDENIAPDLRCFLIPESEQSKKYYNDDLTGEQLYLIYDTASGYMESNSSDFFLFMYLLEGITPEEVRKKPHLLSDYVLKVRAYLGELEAI